MRKHLPTIAIVVGALVAVGLPAYATGRIAYLYATALLPVAEIKAEMAGLTLLGLMLVPCGLVVFAGGWIWRRQQAEIERENAVLRQQMKMKRTQKPGKFAR